MGRVIRLRNVAPVAILAVAAMLLLMSSSGSRTAEAIGFAPTYSVTLSPAGPLIPGDIKTVNTISAPDSNFEAIQFAFTDTAWTINAIDGAGTIGGIAGKLVATSTLGLLNSACNITTPVSITLLASSVEPFGGPDDGDDVGPANANWTGFSDGTVNGGSEASPDGLADGVTNYPKFLDASVSRVVSGAPTSRLFGDTVVGGQPIAVSLLTYAPDGLAAEFSVLEELQAGAAFGGGFVSVLLLQNPSAADAPSNITDFCAPLVTTITTFGRVKNNPATDSFGSTESGIAQVNPLPKSSPGYDFHLFEVGDRDGAPGESAGGDGIEGDLDTCPFVDNIDGTGGVGNPREGFPLGDPDIDAIDSACDNTGVTTIDPALDTLFGFPFSVFRSWDAASECRTGSGDDFLAFDCDADGFFNRQDSCPQLSNFNTGGGNPDNTEIDANKGVTSVNGLYAADGGPSGDGIGDGCDLNPLISDGHFEELLMHADVVVLPFDSDNDGCFDFAEVLTGSDPNDINSTPENVLVGTGGIPGGCGLGTEPAGGVLTCIDGVDNDLDGATDKFDSACLDPFAPLHDVEIASLKGATKADRNETIGYSVRLNNNGVVPEVIPFAIAVIPISGCARPGIDVDGDGTDDVIPASAAGFVDINDDGNPDSLAFSSSGVLKAGKQNAGVDFDVLYKDCPGVTPPVTTIDLTSPATGIPDYVLLVDACHAGDDSALAPLFGGGSCGLVASDGGLDIIFGNDGPVTQDVNNTDYLRIGCAPACP